MVATSTDVVPDRPRGARGRFLEFVRANPGMSAAAAGTILFFFGQGALFSFWSSRNEDKTYALQKIQAEAELQKRVVELHDAALSEIDAYIEARDRYYAAPEHARYSEAGPFFETSARLVRFIDEYNRLEAKLSTLEVRQPRWFNARLLISPVAPRNLRIIEDKPGTMTLTWDPPLPEPVIGQAEANLRTLLAEHGQPNE